MKLFKPFVLLVVFTVYKNNAQAQYITHFELENLTETVTSDTILPSFPGGDTAFFSFLNKNIRYPEVAIQNQMQGRVVVRFTVMPDSTINDVTVLRDIGGGCKQEVVRVLKLMPRWIPGTTKGKTISVDYDLSVKFYCEYHEPPKIEKINEKEIKN